MLQKFIKARKTNKEHGMGILKKYTGLVSVGVGHKTISGENTEEPCILIGVLDKGSFPKGEKIPSEIGGIKTDIVQEDAPTLCSIPQQQMQRPLVGGISMGPSNRLNSGGTLGCCVYHNALGTTKCAITNAHVFTYHNGLYGVPTSSPTQFFACTATGSPCQPGLLDSGNVVNIVGYGLPYVSNALLQGVDAAVFVVSGTGVDITPGAIMDISLPNGLSFIPNNLAIGDSLRKCGSTTGVTVGTVVALDCALNIIYPGCSGTSVTRYMPHQIKTTNMMLGGDSGSILLKNVTNKPVVGLCFASGTTYSYANEWGNVQNIMGIHL